MFGGFTIQRSQVPEQQTTSVPPNHELEQDRRWSRAASEIRSTTRGNEEMWVCKQFCREQHTPNISVKIGPSTVIFFPYSCELVCKWGSATRGSSYWWEVGYFPWGVGLSPVVFAGWWLCHSGEAETREPVPSRGSGTPQGCTKRGPRREGVLE